MVFQQVLFEVRGNVYGADSKAVAYIEAYEPLTPVSEFPECVLGVLRKRDETYPVVNIRKLFGQPDMAKTEGSQILIIIQGDISIGYLVDKVDTINEFTDADIAAVPAIVRNAATGYVRCIAKKGDSLVTMLDFDKLLPKDDYDRIAKIIGGIREKAAEKKAEEERLAAERKRKEREEAVQ